MPVIKRMTSLTKFDSKDQIFSLLKWAKKDNLFLPVHIDDLEKTGISLYVSTENGQITVMTKTTLEDEREFNSWIEAERAKREQGQI